MQRGQPRGAERPVLLLRMLQDQQRDPVLDRRDAVADAQRQRLAAARAFRSGGTRARDRFGPDCFDMRTLYASRWALQQRKAKSLALFRGRCR